MRSRLSARLVGVPFTWDDHDRYGYAIPLVAVGALGAAALALFGLPPLDLHGPLHRVGIMDPLCGMTRATRALARGELATAMRYNPASPLLPLLASAVVLRAAVGRRTGRWVHAWPRRSPALLAIVLVGVAALWVRQQLMVELLR